MTGSFVTDVILIFLICYAVLHILHGLGDAILRHFSVCRHRECLLLPLRSGSETLEFELRAALQTRDDLSCALLIVDDGLNKEEKLMLWRLTDGCEHVTVVEPANLLEKVEQLSGTAINP